MHVSDVSVSNSVRCIIYPAYSFPQFREKNSVLIFLSGHDRFLPNSVRLVIQQFSCHQLCKNLLCHCRKSEVKYTKEEKDKSQNSEACR